MRTCVSCSEEIEDDAKFCTFCGSSQTIVPSKTCVACGSDNQVNDNGLCVDCLAMAIAIEKGVTDFGTEPVDEAEPEIAPAKKQAKTTKKPIAAFSEEKEETASANAKVLKDPASEDSEPKVKARTRRKLETELAKPEEEIPQFVPTIELPAKRKSPAKATGVTAAVLIAIGIFGTIGVLTNTQDGNSTGAGNETSQDAEARPIFLLSDFYTTADLTQLAELNCGQFDTYLKSYINPDQYFERVSGLSAVSTRKQANDFYAENAAWMDLPSYQEAFRTSTNLLAAEIALSEIPSSDLANYEVDNFAVGETFRPILVTTCDQVDEDGNQEKFYEKTSAALGQFDDKIQAVLELRD